MRNLDNVNIETEPQPSLIPKAKSLKKSIARGGLKAGLAMFLIGNATSFCVTMDNLNSGRTVEQVRKNVPRLIEGNTFNDFSSLQKPVYVFVKGCDYAFLLPGRELAIKAHEYSQRDNQ